MLAFPTPRPPAQLRRASVQVKPSSPLPYHHDLQDDVTKRENDSTPTSPGAHDEDGPREELSDLLTKADDLIRLRERGMFRRVFLIQLL
jgi:hypothetical protein